jgi:hypothetical protein
VHYIDQHAPYHTAPAIIEKFDPGYRGRYRLRFGFQPSPGSSIDRVFPYPEDLPMYAAVLGNRLPESFNRHIRRLYAADIRHTNDQLKPLVEKIKSLYGDNLLAVITAAQAGKANYDLIGLAGQQLAAADEALRLTQANLQAGTMTTLDVLQAQDALTQARLRRAETVVRYNQAQVNLLAALGLLDETLLVPAEPAGE